MQAFGHEGQIALFALFDLALCNDMLFAFGVEQGEFIAGFAANNAALGLTIFGQHGGLLVAVENDFGGVKDVFDDLGTIVFCAGAVEVRTDLTALALGFVALDASDGGHVVEDSFAAIKFAFRL